MNTPFASDIKNRRNVIVLGDSLGDVRMSRGVSHDVVLNIGYLNGGDHNGGHSDGDRLSKYEVEIKLANLFFVVHVFPLLRIAYIFRIFPFQSVFDVVLLGDDTLDYPLDLLEQLLQ